MSNMKLRLRHKGRTVPLELNSETTLNILKLQAQDCFHIMSVFCYVTVVTAEKLLMTYY